MRDEAGGFEAVKLGYEAGGAVIFVHEAKLCLQRRVDPDAQTINPTVTTTTRITAATTSALILRVRQQAHDSSCTFTASGSSSRSSLGGPCKSLILTSPWARSRQIDSSPSSHSSRSRDRNAGLRVPELDVSLDILSPRLFLLNQLSMLPRASVSRTRAWLELCRPPAAFATGKAAEVDERQRRFGRTSQSSRARPHLDGYRARGAESVPCVEPIRTIIIDPINKLISLL